MREVFRNRRIKQWRRLSHSRCRRQRGCQTRSIPWVGRHCCWWSQEGGARRRCAACRWSRGDGACRQCTATCPPRHRCFACDPFFFNYTQGGNDPHFHCDVGPRHARSCQRRPAQHSHYCREFLWVDERNVRRGNRRYLCCLGKCTL